VGLLRVLKLRPGIDGKEMMAGQWQGLLVRLDDDDAKLSSASAAIYRSTTTLDLDVDQDHDHAPTLASASPHRSPHPRPRFFLSFPPGRPLRLHVLVNSLHLYHHNHDCRECSA